MNRQTGTTMKENVTQRAPSLPGRLAGLPAGVPVGVPIGLLAVVLTGALLFTACALAPNRVDGVYQAFDWLTAGPEEVGLDAAVLEGAVSQARALGYVRSLLVVKDNRLVTEEYFYRDGFRQNRPWDMRSLTKSMTSALIGTLLRDARLDSAGQTLVGILPDLMNDESDPRKAGITLEHLLTMTAGFPADWDSPLSGGEFDHLQATFDLDLLADPGTQWVYSSLGVHLLSGVISARAERDALAWGQYSLGNSLGITFYSWDRDAAGHPFGGTGLHLMPRDMARFGFLYLRNGLIGGRQLLEADWVQSSIATRIGGTWEWAGIDDLGYGYLWWNGTIGSHRGFFAWGYAGQHIFVFPAVEMIVTTTASFPADPDAGDAQSQAIVALVRDAVLPALAPSAPGAPAFTPDRENP